MRRRLWLTGLAGLAGCSVLPSQPYLQKRDWPLEARRPAVVPPRRTGAALLVRDVTGAPGLETRGLRWKLPDGSLHVDFYEQWVVPPAQAVEDSLRLWLTDSGLFRAVVAPGSRLTPDLVLEGELTEFVGDPKAGVARVALALVLLDERPKPARVLLQSSVAGSAPLTDAEPAAVARALRAALTQALEECERRIAAAIPG